jgi:hypothetical protein
MLDLVEMAFSASLSTYHRARTLSTAANPKSNLKSNPNRTSAPGGDDVIMYAGAGKAKAVSKMTPFGMYDEVMLCMIIVVGYIYIRTQMASYE